MSHSCTLISPLITSLSHIPLSSLICLIINIKILKGQHLTPGPYYSFPSGYAYRQDALINHLLPYLPKNKQLKVLELCSILSTPLTMSTLTYVKRNKLTNLKLTSVHTNKMGYGILTGGAGSSGSSSSNSSTAHGSLDLKSNNQASSSNNASNSNSLTIGSTGSSALTTNERQAYQDQLDDIIAAECPLTGNMAINLVDEPLLSKEDIAAEKSAWEI